MTCVKVIFTKSPNTFLTSTVCTQRNEFFSSVTHGQYWWKFSVVTVFPSGVMQVLQNHGFHPGTPERGCKTEALPPLPFEKGAMGAQVPFHTIIISNFMIYQYQLETNLLQLFVHT